MNISQATSFLKKSLTTGKDFGGVEIGRTEAQRVDSELERISADTVDVKKELSELDKNSALQPPSFKNVSNGQLIAATTSGGAVLGGAFGALRAVAAGPGTVSFNEVNHDIMQPKLNGTGFDIKTYTVGGTPSSPEGWDVDISRRPLTSEKVGQYTTREPISSNTTSIALSGGDVEMLAAQSQAMRDTLAVTGHACGSGVQRERIEPIHRSALGCGCCTRRVP